MNNNTILDKSIDANSKTVRALLSNVRYTIDFYQREYKWELKHVTELLADLENKFTQNYHEGHERSEVQRYQEYFLGSIIISKRKDASYIIDGQQRLTTLTLLLIYLNHLQKDRKDKIVLDDLIFSEKFGKMNFNIEVEERIDVMRALYKNGIDSFDSNGHDQSVQNIISRYRDIEENFSEMLKDEALYFFIDWLREKVVLVEIVAYTDEDAYTIFETMNDRGLSLSPSDMLKGYLLSQIRGDESRREAIDKWKANVLLVREESDGYDESDFFKEWFRAQYAMTIRERKKNASAMDFDIIGTKFHRWVRDNSRNIGLDKSKDFAKFITENMSFYAKVYRQVYDFQLDLTKGFECIYYVNCLGFTLFDPIALSSVSMDDESEIINRKLRVISRYVDIYITRRIWNWSSINYNTMSYGIFQLIKEIRNKDMDQLVSILRRNLSKQEETFLTNDRFHLTKNNRKHVHYILARITHHIQTESGVASNFDDLMNYGDAKPFEIEHIWADKHERHRKEFPNESDFDEYRNRIGGLLLLPKGFNQSFCDLPYKDKVKKYFGQNLLAKSLNEQCYRNNPDFLRYASNSKLQFQPHQEFNKDDLDERQNLYQLLCTEIWDHNLVAKEAEE
jgi:uncharacterized protein with ParB-like and HNH nuclease domain